MSSLTDEQRRRIEENKQRALAIRRQRERSLNAAAAPSTSFYQPVLSASASATAVSSASAPPARVATQRPPTSVAIQRPVEVKLELVDRDVFAVHFKFDQDLIDVCKQMNSRKFDTESRAWRIKLSEYDRFVGRMRATFPNAKLSALPDAVRKEFKAAFEGRPMPPRYTRLDEHRLRHKLGDAFVNALFEYQKDGIAYAVSRNGRALIADDMGLGKTLQALGVLAWFDTAWPLLVVTPSSIRYAWKQAVEDWLPHIIGADDVHVICKAADQYPVQQRRIIVIVSYDLMVNMRKRLMETKFGMVILDESHMIKDYKAQRTQAAVKVVEKTRHLLLLSGTPAMSRPSELYQQICVLRRSVVGRSFRDFALRYCDGQEGKFGIEAKGASNSAELKLVLEETIMIRRLKTDVLGQLPEKTRRMVILDKEVVRHNLSQMKKLKKDVERAAERGVRGSEMHTLILNYYNETGIAKADAVKKYVVDLLDSEEVKCLVFAHHQFVMDAMAERLTAKRIKHMRIDGATSASRRHAACEQFQSDSATRCALLSITAANTGLTLTAANTVVFAELHWNPCSMQQAEDRAHRVGQTACVDVHYLIAAHTADDHLWKLVNSKLKMLGSAGLACDTLKRAGDNKTRIVDTPEEQRKVINTLPLEDYFDALNTPADEPSAKRTKTGGAAVNSE